MTQPHIDEAVESVKSSLEHLVPFTSHPDCHDYVALCDPKHLAALLNYVEGMKWRPMDSAPIGTSFLAAIEVHSEKKGTQWWERHIILIDEDTGAIGDDFYQGWDLGEYEFWMPLSLPPVSER